MEADAFNDIKWGHREALSLHGVKEIRTMVESSNAYG